MNIEQAKEIVISAINTALEGETEIKEDMQQIQPIFFATVPRLLEKIHTGLKSRGQELSGAKKSIYYWALKMAEYFDPETPLKGLNKVKWNIADALVYKKIDVSW